MKGERMDRTTHFARLNKLESGHPVPCSWFHRLDLALVNMTRTSQRLNTPEAYASLLDKFDTFLFDCDGVIWTGPTLVPGISTVLEMLRAKGGYAMQIWRSLKQRSAGKDILFVTNSASKSRKSLKEAFDGFGIQASVVSSSHTRMSRLPRQLSRWIQDEIFGSAYASAVYLSKILNFRADKRVYVIGEQGIEHELRSVGINFTGGTVCPGALWSAYRVVAPKADFLSC
jgi:4-nitrophenyl phosphatase